ncbi:MAG: chromosomal replication initiator protein DnaA [Nitrospirae bacterium]|nr:chromosomal replication initiator protein DnaA [Nitrospirota bacterium]
MSQGQAIWDQALGVIGERIPRQVFDTWFTPVRVRGVQDSCVRLEVPNKFFGDWLTEHHKDLIAESLQTVLHDPQVSFVFVTTERTGHVKQDQLRPEGRPNQAPRTRKPAHLNPKYTFETFVVGASNQFAHAASMRVAEKPAEAYNPLFLYGGVGLGKTHLLNAIGNFVGERADVRIAYVTTEQFTNEVINSIRYDKMMDLRKRYRHIDMLLIDDVQFLAGKERTQEEFFHTFNTLYEAHKQIVLSSDRIPKDMPDIEERLRSRMEWGLIADMKPPDVETRIAILRKKSEDEGLTLPDDVVQLLAESMKSNIRELEGALIRLGAYSSLTGQRICLELAKTVLRDVIGEKKKIIAMDDIEEIVAARYHVRIADLKSRRRSKTLVQPRQIAMYLCRELTDSSFPEIGRQFGGKDHTTIIHGCRQIAKALEANSDLRATIESLKTQIAKG